MKGLIIGFSIAAPVGPIGILCIQRTMSAGRAAGLATGLGAATADAVYGCVAGLGLTFVSGFLLDQQLWLKIAGGLFLGYLGGRTFLATPRTRCGEPAAGGLASAYLTTFFLTLSNPMTILSFAAIFAGLGLAAGAGGSIAALALVGGVFAGSAAWWLLLTSAAVLLGRSPAPNTSRWINRLSGAVLVAFGAAALLSVFWPL